MGNKCFPEGKLLLVHLFAEVCDLSCHVLPATVSPELMSRCVKPLICWHCVIISLNVQVSKQAKFQNVKTKKSLWESEPTRQQEKLSQRLQRQKVVFMTPGADWEISHRYASISRAQVDHTLKVFAINHAI